MWLTRRTYEFRWHLPRFSYGATTDGETKKLKKAIKKNKGSYADYGSVSYRVLKEYEKDVIGIQEPKDLAKLIPVYQKAMTYIKEADNIRSAFISLDPTDSKNDSKYEKILNRIKTLVDSFNSLKTDIGNIDTDDLVQSPLNSSNLMKLCALEKELSATLFKDTADCQYIFPFYSYNDDEDSAVFNKICENALGLECVDEFDDIANILFDKIDTYELIRMCKFAVNPKAKRKK